MKESPILLLKLARFISPRGQRFLSEKIKKEIPNLIINDDDWGSKRRIIINRMNKSSLETIKSLNSFSGIVNIIEFEKKYFNRPTKTLKELTEVIDSFLKFHNVKSVNQNVIIIDFKAFGSLPIHKKALSDRLKKNKYTIVKDFKNHKTAFSLYIDLKNINNVVFVRIGTKKTQFSINRKYPVSLVLCSPFTTQEIADFFRLALVFEIKIILTNENKLVPKLVGDTKETLFKGIDKISYQIVSSLSSMLESRRDNNKFLGFSLWAQAASEDYFKTIKELFKENNELKKSEDIMLIFGNEERGLKFEIQDKIPMFRFGGSVSEPLRSSQAAAYALAILELVLVL